MNIELLHELFLKYPRVSIDSRNIAKDCIFFALKGTNFDGNQYAEDALRKGAIAAVIDNADFKKDDRYILVSDVLKALQQLAQQYRASLDVKVIGITGTNGKTTTKELLSIVLSEKFEVLFTKGNLNNHIGVPLTLLELKDTHQLAVIEMGASKPGDIQELCEIADPDIALITNVGRAHLEGFGSPEGVVKTKSELYEYVMRKEGIIIFNSNDSLLSDRIKDYKAQFKLSYGNSNQDFCRGTLLSSDPLVTVQVYQGEQPMVLRSGLVGSYNANNIMAAVCIGKYFHIEMEKIISAVESYKPINNRSQIVNTKFNTIMADCYNANPTSMKAAIESFMLIPVKEKKRILILGDMLELGAYSDQEHCSIIDMVLELKDTEVFLVGENFKKNIQSTAAIEWFENVESLKEEIEKREMRNSLILLKGSRGIQLEKLLEVL